MKSYWGIGLFAGGLLAGWVIRDEGEAMVKEKTTVEAPASRTSRPRDTSPREFPHTAKVREFMTKNWNEDVSVLYDAIPEKDRMKTLELMAMQVGPDTTTMNYDLKRALDKFLEKWAEKDFEDAWTSATFCENDGLRRYMVNQLLERLGQTEPDKAFELYLERTAAGDEVSPSVPLRVLTKKSGEGTDAFLNTMLKVPRSGASSTSTDMTFSDDFDFGRVAEALTELKKANSEYRPAAFPSNFLQKWAEQDIDAAHGWWMVNGDFGNSRWSGFFDAIEKKSGSAEAAQWAAMQLQDAGKLRVKMIESISNTDFPQVLISRTGTIADAMPDTGSRDRFYIDLMKYNHYGDVFDRYDFAITKLSSPEARLQALEEISSRGYHDLTMASDSKLQAWGITREQAAEAVKRGSK